MTVVGHPDWIPAPRGYAGALIYPLTNTTVNAFSSQSFTFTAAQLYDVNVIEAIVPATSQLIVFVKDDTGQSYNAYNYVNPSAAAFVANIPVRARGGDMIVQCFNKSAAAKTFTMAVKGFNGVPVTELRMPPAADYRSFTNLAAGGTSVALNMAGIGLYDRVAWTAWCDRAFSVICQRVIDAGAPLVLHAETLKSAAAGGVLSGEMDVGCPGFWLEIHNDDGVNVAAGGITMRCSFRSG